MNEQNEFERNTTLNQPTENETRQEQEEKMFTKISDKSNATAKKILTIVFGSSGAFFVLLGIILALAIGEETFLFAFGGYGLFFIIISVIFHFVKFDSKKGYQRYKKQTEKYGSLYSTMSLAIATQLNEQKITQLQEQVDELTKQVQELQTKSDELQYRSRY